MPEEEIAWCKLCGARPPFHGFTYPALTDGKSVACPNQTKEQALAGMNSYHAAWLIQRKAADDCYVTMLRQLTELKQQIRVVCHENNKLRKKVRNLE